MIINHINKYLINLFSDITNDLNLNNPQFRILKESQYFEIYLKFLSNSTYFSRFSYDIKIIKNNEHIIHTVTVKYLNEKINKWSTFNVFDLMYSKMINEYAGIVNCKYPELFKNIKTDTLFIPNKYAFKKNIGKRNKYYKCKYGLKLSTCTDILNTPIDISIDNGNKNDAKIFINQIPQIGISLIH